MLRWREKKAGASHLKLEHGRIVQLKDDVVKIFSTLNDDTRQSSLLWLARVSRLMSFRYNCERIDRNLSR